MLRPFCAAAVLALAAPAQGAEVSLAHCGAPAYSAEALRYEMEGTTGLDFSLTAQGLPAEIRVAASSGYAMLDAASVALLANCRFPAPAAEGPRQAGSVRWQLPAGGADVKPVLQPHSCTRRYQVLAPAPAGAAPALLVRVQVWPDGSAYTPKIEMTSGEAEADALALAVVEHCRFAPAVRAGQPVHGAALVAFALDREAIGEDSVRAEYERIGAELARQKEFKVAHILFASEPEASAALRELQGGAPFGAMARARSLDKASGKVDGELGWVKPADFVAPFGAALRAHEEAGLLPAPVHTVFGWHLIVVRETRALSVPAYEQVRERVRSKLISQPERVVQAPPARP